MIRILLACAGGMSTSLLMTKMLAAAEEKGIEVTVDAHSEKSVEKRIGTFDVLLLGPQVGYVLKNMQKLLDGKAPVDVIPMRQYGTMDGAAVLELALKMYDEFYNK